VRTPELSATNTNSQRRKPYLAVDLIIERGLT
jgi:hypothetical protein